ncbi:MAG: protein YgfX [Usitatibacter sp.]
MEMKMEADEVEHKYSEAPCFVALAPSRAGAAIIAIAALATLALIAATPGEAALRILAATWVACAALEAIHSRAFLRGPRAARALRLRGGGAIEVLDASGRWREGSLQRGSFVAPWLTIVRWRAAGERFSRTLPIIPGMAGDEEFRRLRVMLRWS